MILFVQSFGLVARDDAQRGGVRRAALDAEMQTDARSRRVRHHRRVRRRYLARRAASRATPTMTSTTANIAMAAMISMAITPSFDQYGARFGDAERQYRHSTGLVRRVPKKNVSEAALSGDEISQPAKLISVTTTIPNQTLR